MTTDTLLADFEALLRTAATQEEPQRLLFVFARKRLEEQATAIQRERFERGEGGYLKPCLCVDKASQEVANFEALASESEQTGISWDIVFVSSFSGRGGIPPSSDEASQPLRFMLSAVKEGRVADMAAFDRMGRAIRFV